MVKKQKNKQLIYIIIMVVMLSSTGFLVYRNYIKDPGPDSQLSATTTSDDSIDVGALTPIQAPDLLPRYLNNLIKFGLWPVEVGTLGRSNPFLPL